MDKSDTPPRAPSAVDNDQLFVRNVPYAVSEEDVQQHFGVVGKVVFVKLLQGADGRPRGQARVRMKSPEEAKAALALDGREFGGRVLKVQADERRNVG